MYWKFYIIFSYSLRGGAGLLAMMLIEKNLGAGVPIEQKLVCVDVVRSVAVCRGTHFMPNT